PSLPRSSVPHESSPFMAYSFLQCLLGLWGSRGPLNRPRLCLFPLSGSSLTKGRSSSFNSSGIGPGGSSCSSASSFVAGQRLPGDSGKCCIVSFLLCGLYLTRAPQFGHKYSSCPTDFVM